jgi:hypothetical protein
MILPRLVVIPRLGAEGSHEAIQVMAILAVDMLLDNGESRPQARGIDI